MIRLTTGHEPIDFSSVWLPGLQDPRGNIGARDKVFFPVSEEAPRNVDLLFAKSQCLKLALSSLEQHPIIQNLRESIDEMEQPRLIAATEHHDAEYMRKKVETLNQDTSGTASSYRTLLNLWGSGFSVTGSLSVVECWETPEDSPELKAPARARFEFPLSKKPPPPKAGIMGTESHLLLPFLASGVALPQICDALAVHTGRLSDRELLLGFLRSEDYPPNLF